MSNENVPDTAQAENSTASMTEASGVPQSDAESAAAAASVPLDSAQVPHDQLIGDELAGQAVADQVGADQPAATVEVSEEAVVALIAERDEYLDGLQRLKAEFANARRRFGEQAASQRQQAASDLVLRLLPVLDSAQAALQQGVEEVRPLHEALLEVLTSQGLAQLDPVGDPFDPEQHEAVLFEEGDGDQVVAETMRLGYVWNDRVLRAAMVKVRG